MAPPIKAVCFAASVTLTVTLQPEILTLDVTLRTSGQHYGIRGGVRNFFYVWCQQALISHLSGCQEPRSKECPLYFSILGPPGPKIDQKWSQMAQKRSKSDFEGSGGPERLERRGTKLERVTGHICWDFQTNWECVGAPNFGPGAPKKGPNGPKTAKI